MMTHLTQIESLVIPAKAGIQSAANWTSSTFAGVTLRKVSDELSHPCQMS
jgi:hypothetical protein